MVFGLKLLNSRVLNGLIWIALTLIVVEIITVSAQNTTTAPTVECRFLNGSCESCVKNTSCYYCYNNDECDVYSVTSTKCLKNMAYKTCLVKYNVLLIVGASIGGALLLALIICCCCCCRKVKRHQIASQLAKWERQRVDRKAHQDERREEREARRNEIRQKYGLGTKEGNNYKRFE